MEVTYQRRCAQYIYVVPEGLRELMSDISREVLREQPKDLCLFIADYLEAMMVTRENARVAAKAVSHMADTSEVISELLRRTNMSKDQANRTVEIIQKAFKKHLRRKATRHEALEREPLLQKIIKKTGMSYVTVENAVRIIQRAYRMFKFRRMKESPDVVDWRKAFVRTMEIYRKSRITQEEANRAATLIKSAYKGYYTRRVLRKYCKDYDTTRDEEEIRVHTTESWQIVGRPEEEELIDEQEVETEPPIQVIVKPQPPEATPHVVGHVSRVQEEFGEVEELDGLYSEIRKLAFDDEPSDMQTDQPSELQTEQPTEPQQTDRTDFTTDSVREESRFGTDAET